MIATHVDDVPGVATSGLMIEYILGAIRVVYACEHVTTLEPWQVLQLFVVGDFWTCSCHARGAPSGGKMSISHGCGGLMRALGHEKLPWRVVL